MNKEAFKAAVDRICEEAEVELQQRVKENQLKAIIWEEIIVIVKHAIWLPGTLLATGRQKYLAAPSKEHVSLLLVIGIAHETLPHDLDLLWFEHALWTLSNQESQEIQSLCHLLWESVIVDAIGHHRVQEVPIVSPIGLCCSN